MMRTLGLAALSLLIAAAVFAVPLQINYQGQLANPSGTPLDTTVIMTFKLYTDSTAGTLLWTESRPSVNVSNGAFNVRLGEISTLFDATLNQSQVWLGITVGNNSEMTPRGKVLSAPYAYRVGTVDGANGGTISGKLNVGSGNTNEGQYAQVAGEYNHARGDYSFVGGGGTQDPADSNSVLAGYSSIVGGRRHVIDALATSSVIVGGYGNVITGNEAIIGGGYGNTITGNDAVIAGGSFNRARGPWSAIGGGGGPFVVDSNSAQGYYSTIAGGTANTTSSGTFYTTIAGGYGNLVSASNSVIGGGGYNRARGAYSVAAGGGGSTAADSNSASGDYCTVGGGSRNTANGDYSSVPGGYNNHANGDYSFCAGNNASAAVSGCFVWADATGAGLIASGSNQFVALASGGTAFFSSPNLTTGVYVSAGGSGWNSVSDSTKKENIQRVNTAEVLDKVSKLPISEWNYKTQDAKIRHMGPMAQDFYASLGLGESDTTINSLDPDGVALAAIQELAKENLKLETKNQELEERMARLEGLLQSQSAGVQQSLKEER